MEYIWPTSITTTWINYLAEIWVFVNFILSISLYVFWDRHLNINILDELFI